MWIADVGQNLWEEVNVVSASDKLNKNYGWRCYEGTHVYNSTCTAQANNVYPIFEYPHNDTSGGYAITGGYVYRGTEYPSLQGYYLFADFSTGLGWLTRSDSSGGWTTTRQSNWVSNISSFGETSTGTLYATTLSGGLYKLVAANPLPVRLVSFSGSIAGNAYRLAWQVQNEQQGEVYIIEKRKAPSEPFRETTRVTAVTNSPANNYSVTFPMADGEAFYRLKIIAKDGQIHYSKIVSYNNTERQRLKAYVVGPQLKALVPQGSERIEVLDALGRQIAANYISSTIREVNIQLSSAPNGILLVRVFVNGEWQVVKVMN